jgi:hypothetical protein
VGPVGGGAVGVMVLVLAAAEKKDVWKEKTQMHRV